MGIDPGAQAFSRASTSAIARWTLSAIVKLLVSSKSASSARRSGAALRPESRSSRARISASTDSRCTTAPFFSSSAKRRCARISGEAVTNSFASASGAITVPISRPSRMAPPLCRANDRCRASKASRTPRCAETMDAVRDAASDRIAGSASMASLKSHAAKASAASAGSPPDRSTAMPTAR
jgi:hypothetical protein